MGTDKFKSRSLTEEQKMRANQVTDNFTMLHDLLDMLIPNGREKSLYITKLEEASMWAVKAISREENIDN